MDDRVNKTKQTEKKELTNRAKQALKTRKRIIRSMKKLVKKKGFENTSVKEISEDAGITVGTFYHYFSSKEALLSEFLPKSDTLENSKIDEDVHSYILLIKIYEELIGQSVTKDFDEMREVWSFIIRSYSTQKIIDDKRIPMIERIIKRGQLRGEFIEGVDAAEIAQMIVLTNHGIFYRNVHAPETIDYKKLANETIRRLLYTYLTERGKSSLPHEFIL